MNTIIIIISSVVFLALLYIIIRKIFDRVLINRVLSSSVSLAHLKFFERQAKDIEVFFFGACEFNSGIDPRKFQHKAFNFAIQIASYPEQYYFFKHYIDKMDSLKLLVLSVGDNSFCSYASTGVTFPLMFSRFINYNELLSVSKPKMWLKILWYKWLYSTDLGTLHYGRKFFIQRFKKLIRQKRVEYGAIRRTLQKKVFGRNKPEAEKSKVTGIEQASQAKHGETEKPKTNMRPKVCATAKDGVIGVEKHFTYPLFDEKALLYLEKILTLCKERNIPVVTVSMPRSKYFLDIAKEKGYVTERLFLDKIINDPKYQRLIFKHLNYLSLYRDRDDLFQAEGALLNAEGRREFTSKILHDLTPIIDEIVIQEK